MSEALTFRVETGDTVGHYVKEAGSGRQVAWWSFKANAQAHVDVLNEEHADGRVAQAKCHRGHTCERKPGGTCQRGEPCDRERIVSLPIPANLLAALVLCETCRAEVAASTPCLDSATVDVPIGLSGASRKETRFCEIPKTKCDGRHFHSLDPALGWVAP